MIRSFHKIMHEVEYFCILIYFHTLNTLKESLRDVPLGRLGDLGLVSNNLSSSSTL